MNNTQKIKTIILLMGVIIAVGTAGWGYQEGIVFLHEHNQEAPRTFFWLLFIFMIVFATCSIGGHVHKELWDEPATAFFTLCCLAAGGGAFGLGVAGTYAGNFPPVGTAGVMLGVAVTEWVMLSK